MNFAIIRTMKQVLATVLVLGALSAVAEKQPYSRYESIVIRQMFGPLPRDFDPTKMPSEVQRGSEKQLTQEQEKLKSAVQFSVINQTPAGELEVGFSDFSDPTTPMHYFLKVGETQDGWTVEKADLETATTTLVKNDIVLDLALGDNSAKGGGSASKRSASAAPSAVHPSVRTGETDVLPEAKSLRARRAEREERSKLEREERSKLEREEMMKGLRAEFAAKLDQQRVENAEVEKAKAEAEKAKADAAKAKAEAERAKAEAERAKAESAEKKEGSDGENNDAQ